jgi:hypothetical protein
VEIPEKHRRKAFEVADPGAVVVPRSARGLVGLVEVLDAEAIHEPQQRGRISRDVAALSARFVVPEPPRRNLLVPAVERLHHDRLLLVGDAVDDDLAVLFQLPHDVAHVLHALFAGLHRAPVYLQLDPGGRDARVFGR